MKKLLFMLTLVVCSCSQPPHYKIESIEHVRDWEGCEQTSSFVDAQFTRYRTWHEYIIKLSDGPDTLKYGVRSEAPLQYSVGDSVKIVSNKLILIN